MSRIGSAGTAALSTDEQVGDVAPQSTAAVAPVVVHSCSRLGLHANPPSFRLSIRHWFRRR
ncbi:MAG: hypothetical protein JWR37_1364 [Mycobacterium sp.]|nr:hypothetical protein [Mycobacterium sp.]